MDVKEWLDNNQLSCDIWHKKYQRFNESLEEWFDRISDGDEEIKSLIKSKKFLPGGRIMSNIGINEETSSLMNCYSRGFIEDDYNDIMQAVSDIGRTFKSHGGQGLSLSKLRPRGTRVGTSYESDGIIPFMKLYNEVTNATSQGGARKGALMISLDAWHKEAMDFITIKSTETSIDKANISLEIDDEFMKAVEKYYLTGEKVTVHRKQNYSGHNVEWDVTPIDVFKAMIHNNYDWGDPGCLFVNRFRNYNIMEKREDYNIETSNPCGEQPLKKNSACCLSSINMSQFVIDPYTELARFDEEGFLKATKAGIRYLDHVVDLNMNRHPLKEQRENSYNYRNIGLGVFGFGTALMKMGITYGSDNCIKFVDDIFSKMFKTAVSYSSELAKELGSFPLYDERVWDSKIIKKHFNKQEIEAMKLQGLRNCSVLSVAPTGSLATLLGETGGVEPEFAISYTRRTVGLTNNEDRYYTVYCKAAKEYMDKYNTEELPEYFISSADINPIARVTVQGTMQNHIDTAISSTVNLPEEATEEQMEKIYLEAWKQGLKGLTIFRNNCKKLGILTTGNTQKEVKEEKNTVGRGVIFNCSDNVVGKKKKLQTGCGSTHVLAYFDPDTGDMQEVYLNKGSTGGCANYMSGLSRMISLALRAGVDIYTIKDQLDSTGACPSYAVRAATHHDTSKGSCCPMAIGNALVELYEEFNAGKDEDDDEDSKPVKIKAKNKVAKIELCPECGEPIVRENGCVSCKNCGWSKCG